MTNPEDNSEEVPNILDLQRSIEEIAERLRSSRPERKQPHSFDLSRRSSQERQSFLVDYLQFHVRHQKLLNRITEIQKDLESL